MQLYRKVGAVLVATLLSLSTATAYAQSCPSQYTPGALLWQSRNATTGALTVGIDPYDLDSINASYAKAVNQYGTVIAILQTSSSAFMSFTIPRGTGTVTVYVGNMNRCNTFVNWVYYTALTN